MGDDPRPIGIFDSGIGGFSVLAEIRKVLANESLVYVADHRYAPYGERSLEEVADRSVEITGQLIDAGAKAVVVACNSASAAALYRLRATFAGTPFIGMEPAVKPAALRSEAGVVGVLATSATFQGELFASVVDRHANGTTVLPIVGSGLASLIEDGGESSAETTELLARLLEPALAAGMDTLVLGCTHYPFLSDAIASVVGDAVTVVDPSAAVARQVERTVTTRRLSAPGGVAPHFTFASTGNAPAFETQARRLLDVPAEATFRRW